MIFPSLFIRRRLYNLRNSNSDVIAAIAELRLFVFGTKYDKTISHSFLSLIYSACSNLKSGFLSEDKPDNPFLPISNNSLKVTLILVFRCDKNFNFPNNSNYISFNGLYCLICRPYFFN